MIRPIYDRVAELIGSAVPMSFGMAEAAEHASAPRIAFIPDTETIVGTTTLNANPLSLGDRHMVVKVWCWGIDFAQAERLYLTVHTAIRKAVHGRNFSVGTAQWGNTAKQENGVAVVIPITIHMPAPEQTLPWAATDKAAATVTITAVDQDKDAPVAGDGILESGDT